MSFADRLVLWLHITFVIFTIGPVTLAISSTPRYIKKRDLPVLRYLARITVVFTILTLGVLGAGIGLAQIDHDFSHPWLTVSMTLYVVAVVLLVLVIRDQRKAIRALSGPAPVAAAAIAPPGGAASAGQPTPPAADQPGTATGPEPASDESADRTTRGHIASVERGRITMLGGVVNLLWLVILVLMIWRP
jgi:hypothetical protein